MLGLRLLVVVAVLLLSAMPAVAAELRGEVIGIADGDTLTLLMLNRQQMRVRLAEIDAPESRQPWGSRARQALAAMVFRKEVAIETQGSDRYGRTIGRVTVRSLDVNAEMIRQGNAWGYRQYMQDRSLLAVEEEARNARRGLWSLPEGERTPPWIWRRQERPDQRIALPSINALGGGALVCGHKRFCREMTSCAEARFYLQQCGASRLDGDHDGVPCEAMCR